MSDVIFLVGMLAGALVTASSLPKLRERAALFAGENPAFNKHDLSRDLLQATGNCLWLYVALSAWMIPLVIFSSLNILLLGSMIFFNLCSLKK